MRGGEKRSLGAVDRVMTVFEPRAAVILLTLHPNESHYDRSIRTAAGQLTPTRSSASRRKPSISTLSARREDGSVVFKTTTILL